MKFNKSPMAVSVVSFVFVALGLAISVTVFAATATAPPLGTAASFSVLGANDMTSAAASPGTTISGDLGISPGIESQLTGFWTHSPVGGANYFGTGGLSESAQADALIAFNNLIGQTPTALWSSESPLPGVWNIAADTTFPVGHTLTLNGGYNDVWVFQIGNSMTFNGSVVLTGNAQACNVFWKIGADVTIGLGSTFVGTLIAQNNITSASGATINGRLISLTGTTIAMNGAASSITGPTCAVAPKLTFIKDPTNDNGGNAGVNDFNMTIGGVAATSGIKYTKSANTAYAINETQLTGYTLTSITGDAKCPAALGGTITLDEGDDITCTITNNDIAPQLIVIKTIINDNNGTITSFPLFIDNMSVTTGVASTTSIGLHTVSETADSGYTATIGGHCATDGTITLALGDIKTCTITNDDIAPPVSRGGGSRLTPPVPPLIDVVKVPSPLALPAGPGSVTYTYTLRNIGTVPVTDITMVGDTCSPIILASGDTNSDAKLDVKETWTYRCSTTLSETHTNTVTATGWANGISAVDIASATVVVGAPVTPPLIHVKKVPSVLALPAAGGAVTYTYTVTNPGAAPLSNVSITDDKCTGLPGRVSGHPGDINKNDLLESNETWNFTCQSKLTQTTTNIGTAEGSANGLIAKDFAIATVVVANVDPTLLKAVATVIPMLPNAGFSPLEESMIWSIITPIVALILVLTSLIVIIKKRII